MGIFITTYQPSPYIVSGIIHCSGEAFPSTMATGGVTDSSKRYHCRFK